ncbi:hypothetical protein DVH24_023441 [Malus domestica]|uniref:Uncharacterized protein n=1 Tax=Malus domestica TaxID=3750 RepID=A0A498I5E9_MALDO|nr:hypothetical protein DVH24_023441 [Malus domestica]
MQVYRVWLTQYRTSTIQTVYFYIKIEIISRRYRLVCKQDETEWKVMGWDGTGQNEEGAKMPSDGNKEEEEGD